jgi:hypothetical protein
MIAFYRDNLVPPELCQLLYLTVPEEHHTNVIFVNHATQREERGLKRGWNGCFRNSDPPTIAIELNGIWAAAGRAPGSLEFRLWHELLRVCYHEFGHAATVGALGISSEAYEAGGRECERVEHEANQWAHRQILYLLEHDTRLAQPANFGGYYGARLSAWFRALNTHRPDTWDSGVVARVKHWRYLKTGGQFTAGEVLQFMGQRGAGWYNHYRLRRASAGLGIDYTDGAGRLHKFYTYGDLPILAARLKSQPQVISQPAQYSGPEPMADDTEIPF